MSCRNLSSRNTFKERYPASRHRNQRCRFGDHCARLHLASLDATRDIRPFVELRPTSEMKAGVWTGETGELRDAAHT